MLEQIISTGLGAIIGAAIGGALTAKIVSSVTKAELTALADRTRVEIQFITQRMEKHEEALGRAMFRDMCRNIGGGCKEEKESRHDEYLRWHTDYIKRLEGLEASFRSCFDDLVEVLRDKK